MHERLMQRALQLAEKGRYTCSPNPMVGCVIAQQDRIVGEGWHQHSGEPHAEVNALTQAGKAAAGATAYVNLEPCCHYGHTPPCVDALIAAKLSHVVIGCLDLNPKVAGKGVKALQEAGIRVTVGIAEEASLALNYIFLHAITHQKPYVIAKYAMSIDGKLATHCGDAKWLTGTLARQHVHYWRHQIDAILVGSGTVLQDNPQLTVRLPNKNIPDVQQPLRIILDGSNTIPSSANIFSAQLPGKTLLASQIVAHHENRIDIHLLLNKLYEMRINSLIVEGGPKTLTQFFANDQVDEIHCYVAAKLIGGAQAPTAFMGDGIDNVVQAKAFTLFAVERFENDVLIIYRRQ